MATTLIGHMSQPKKPSVTQAVCSFFSLLTDWAVIPCIVLGARNASWVVTVLLVLISRNVVFSPVCQALFLLCRGLENRRSMVPAAAFVVGGFPGISL